MIFIPYQLTLSRIISALGFTPSSTIDVSNKVDKVGTADIEITNAAKGLILKDTVTGLRIRLSFANGILTGTTL